MNKQARYLAVLALWLLALVAHAGTVTYIHTDAQGTPVMESDAQGHITKRFEYTPYGEAVTSMGAAPNEPGYTGHVNDPETGLVYMQARYYDPVAGRFLSVDPVGPKMGNVFNFNRFSYVNDNPIRYIDPNGEKTYDCRSSSTCPAEMKIGDLKTGDIVKTTGATLSIGSGSISIAFNRGFENGSSAALLGPIIVPISPAGVSLSINAKQAGGMSPRAFRNQVKNKGPWDYKQQGRQYEEFGNFNYGAMGRAAGFPSGILLQEAGRAQVAAGTSTPSWGVPGVRGLPFTGSGSFGDDTSDQFWIEQGVREYESWQMPSWTR